QIGRQLSEPQTGGMWIDPDASGLNVNVTSPDQEAIVRALGGKPHLVAHSLTELNDAKARIDHTAKHDGVPAVAGWGGDIRSDTLRVEVGQDDAATRDFLARVRAIWPSVEVVSSAGGYQRRRVRNIMQSGDRIAANNIS